MLMGGGNSEGIAPKTTIYDWPSKPIVTARRQQSCLCSIGLNICRHRFRTCIGRSKHTTIK